MNNQRLRTVKTGPAQKYASARANLLLVIVFTVINVAMLLFGSDSMFLFSATLPYFLTLMGIVTGYTEGLAVGLGLAAVLIVAYLLCWIFSKKRFGWMVTAFVLFILDTVFLLWFYISIGEAAGIIDIVFHAWIIYSLITAVIAGPKALVPEEVSSEAEISDPKEEAGGADSQPIYTIDPDEKARVFCEGTYMGHTVVFRRVKKTNELVIDKRVYAQVEMLIEPAFVLEARVDGIQFTAAYTGTHSIITANGEEIAKKFRAF